MLSVFSVVICICATGCTPLEATPPSTLQVVEGAITPALRPLEMALQGCAQAHPEMALFIEEVTASSIEPGEFAFRFGEPPGGSAYAMPVAWEEILVILNASNPLTDLSTSHLGDLFAGSISTWDELSDAGGPVQVWVYPEGDDVRQVFDATVLGEKAISARALLAPDPAAMLEAISTDPGAIGYLPRAWLEVESRKWQVKAARLEAGFAGALRRPVLAVAAKMPVGGTHTLLTCLQGSNGRQSLEGLYDPWEG